MSEQPSGYHFEVVGEKIEEHECPICLMLIREAVELPCEHLMCDACLQYLEERELARNPMDAQFRCTIDRKIYRRNQKKKFGSMDRIIKHSIRVKCKQSDNCDWTGTISNYQEHHINVCGWMLVECPNDECRFSDIRRRMQQHKCEYRTVGCDHCGIQLKYNLMNDHHQNDCQHFPTVCPNNGCNQIMQRNQMEFHRQNDCQFEGMHCPFKELGCNEKVLRCELDEHCKHSNTQHTMFLLNQINALNTKIEQQNQEIAIGNRKNEELNEEIENQNEEKEETNKKVKKLNEKIDNQNEMIVETNKKVKELNEKIENQNEIIEKQRDKITKLENEINQQKENLSSKIETDVKNLNLFAEQVSKLLTSVASFENHWKNENVDFFLHNEKYETDDDVRKWRELVDVKQEEKIDCKYLKELKESVQKYQNFLYPNDDFTRIRLTAKMMERNQIYYVGYRNCYVKLDYYYIKFMNLRFDEFIRWKNPNENWIIYSNEIATYINHATKTYHVVVIGYYEKVFLMNEWDPSKDLQLNVNGTTRIEKVFDYYRIYGDSLILKLVR